MSMLYVVKRQQQVLHSVYLIIIHITQQTHNKTAKSDHVHNIFGSSLNYNSKLLQMLSIHGGNKGLEGTEVDLFTIILTLLCMLLVILFIKKYNK